MSTFEKGIIDEQITNLLTKGVIVECHGTTEQFVSNVFVREKKDGSFRMILNLKELNDSVVYEKFKMETLHSIINLMRKNCYMCSLDLTNAYYTIPVAEEHQPYLRFPWRDKLYQFTCFPNGLAEAPRKFTKLMKPVFAYLRSQGFTNAIYIDDTYLQGATVQECRDNVEQTEELLVNLGFAISETKSVKQPTQQLAMLGFTLDSGNMLVHLTDKKAQTIKNMCLSLNQNNSCSLQHLAEIIGKIVSTFPGVEYGQMHYRGLDILKTKGLRWNAGKFAAQVNLNKAARRDLRWWIGNVMGSCKQISHGNPSVVMMTDASKKGWGAAMNGTSTGGRWTEEEAELDINCLETKAALFGIICFCKNMRNTHVRLMIDNSTAVCYINAFGGTKSQTCNDLAKQIWDWCIERNIWVSAAHIAGVDNVEADRASRVFNDRTEWMLDRNVFHELSGFFGVPDIDLFATRLNAQIQRYVSWKPDPLAEAFDAFTLNWKNYFSYMFPPFNLIGRCLQKIAFDQAECWMVVPAWATQYWFPELIKMLMDSPILLPFRNLVSLPGCSQAGHPLKLQLMACRLSGDLCKVEAFLKRQQTSSGQHGGLVLKNNTVRTWRSGRPIVSRNKLIYFTHL